MTKKELGVNNFYELSEIFRNNSWDLESHNEVGLFNRFVNTLTELSDEQQELILELTHNFIRVGINDYLTHCKELLKMIDDDPNVQLETKSNLYIAPLISPEDVGKTKSSTALCYFFKVSSLFSYSLSYSNKNINYFDNLEVGLDVNDQNSLLLVVDDFVGTGDTAFSALEYLVNSKNINPENIIVLAIAGMNLGIEKIISYGIKVFISIKVNKGISDNSLYTSDEIEAKLNIMREIEKKIKVHKNERLGYMQSEALIELGRTPNNTFPFYWKKKNGRLAPFPR